MSKDTEEKKAYTYEEVALSPEILQRGVHLVAPLSRILLRRSKDVKQFHGRHSMAEWEALEKEFPDIVIPEDYKLLVSTVGVNGLWLNGSCTLTGPHAMAKSIRNNNQDYATWQLEGDAYKKVGCWPDQPAFHMECLADYEGNALSYYWCCAKSQEGAKGAYPVVHMELEAPLRHNGPLYLCTVTEALYRDVVNQRGMGDYENEDDEDADDEEEEFEYEKIVFGEGEDARCVYQFDRNSGGEPPKTKAKVGDDAKEEDIGEVGSEQDKKDMSLLDGVEVEIIRNLAERCKAMAPVTFEEKK